MNSQKHGSKDADRKFYLFDPQMVQRAEQVSLKQGTVKKTVTNASWVDQHSWTPDCGIPDWERRVSILYPNVEYDETSGTYKIWYHALEPSAAVDEYHWRRHLIDRENSNHVDLKGFSNTARGTIRDGHDILCYMESKDGINWTRPELGEFFYQTRTGEIIGTNIVRVGLHGQAVRRNENPDPNEPAYLLAGRAWETDSLDAKGAPIGVAIAWSDDGIHWEEPVTIKTGYDCSDEIRAVRADSHNQLFWSEERGRYVVITRGYSKRDPSVRLVVFMESTGELQSIRDLQKIKRQEAGKYWEQTSQFWSKPEIVLDHRVTLDAQPYTMPAAHMAQDCYIGVACVANFDKETDGVWNSVHAQLTWSRDARTWHYMEQGKPFIANAPVFKLEPGNDYGMIYCAAPVQVGETSQIFYAAIPELHYVAYDEIPEEIRQIVAQRIPKAAENKMFTRTSTLNIASVQKDRFAGLWSENGWIVTRPFTLCGSRLLLTADAAPGGSVKLELLEPDGSVIPGYGAENFCAVETDTTDQAVCWEGRDLSELAGKTVSLRILLQNAGIYTLSGDLIAETKTGG